MPETERELLRLFRIRPVPEETLHLFIQIIIALILLFVTIQVILYLYRKNKQMHRAWAWFYRMCEAKDLSIEEMKILRDLALLNKLKFKPEKILDSINEFDRAVIKMFRNPRLSDFKRDRLEMDISELRKKLMFDYLPPDEILRTTHGIEKGQRFRIELQKEEHVHYYSTSVHKNSEKALIVYMPVIPGHDTMFEEGQEFEVYFWRHRDAGYRFRTKILEISKGFPMLLYLSHTEEIDREQRRHFYRIDISLPIFFHRMSVEEILAWEQSGEVVFAEHEDLKEGKIIGLSGGGLKFTVTVTVEKGDFLLMKLKLGPDKVISPVIGKIILVKKISERISKVSVEFAHISEQHRETIIRQIAIEQRRRLKL